MLVLLQNLVLYDGVDGVGSGVRQVLGGGVVGVEPAEPVALLPHPNLLLLHPVLLVTNHRPGTADSKTKPYSQLLMILSQNLISTNLYASLAIFVCHAVSRWRHFAHMNMTYR